MKQSVKDIMDRCRHFTGIQHKVCKAGVCYETFRKPNGALVPLPCFSTDKSVEVCDKAEWYTEDEAVKIDAEHELAVVAFLENIASGKCHICKIVVAQEQVGRCVYGSCGHRLYQGKVNPKFVSPGGDTRRAG